MTNRSQIANSIRPSSPISGLPYVEQMALLRDDIRFMHREHGPLRQQGEWVRAHFYHRLADARAKQAA